MNCATAETSSWKTRATVIIVSYRSRRTIASTLDALEDARDGGFVEIVVVDNASDDGTADFVATAYPFVTLIRNPENSGFGRGCNLGFAKAASPYLLLLNPDAVIRRDSIQMLIDFMDRNPRAGICGPAVRWSSGELQASGDLPNPLAVIAAPLFPRWAMRARRLILPGDEPRSTSWICGSIMLLRKSMIDEIGPFDPRFFLYFEETDLCYRARRDGWEVWAVGDACGSHANAASARATESELIGDTIPKHYFESRYYYLVKHYGWPAAALAEIGELVSIVLRTAVDAARRRPNLSLKRRLRGPFMRQPRAGNAL